MSEQFEQGQAEILEIPQAEAQAEAEPQLADDGIGITLDEARALLAMKHDQLLGKDDPVLMMVTLLNAYLGEMEKQHKRHESAMRALLNAETAKYQQMLAATFQPGQAGQTGQSGQKTAAAVNFGTAVPPPNLFDRFGILAFIGLGLIAVFAAIWLANMVWGLK